MRLMKLRQQKADLVKAGRAVLDAANENGVLSEAEQAKYDATLKEIAAVDGAIKREEQFQEFERDAAPLADPNADAARTGRKDEPKRFKTFGEQMMAVARAGMPAGRGHAIDQRLQFFGAGTGLSEGIASDGGFLVQTDFEQEILKRTYELGEITKRVRRIPISANSNGVKINGIDETSRANGSRWGGVRAYWASEAALMTASAPKFREIKLELQKLTGLCYATEELLKDTTALGAILEQAFAEEFSFKVEDAIVNGLGAGQPLGILNSGAVITVNKESGQAAATLVAANIAKMWARMWARSRRDAVWLINQDVEPQLTLMFLAITNVAGTENVGGIGLANSGVSYVPAGVNGNPYALLMGRPVIPVEYCATLGTAGDVLLVDLSQYVTIDKGNIEGASSIHVRFLYDEMTFRFVYRVDGQPTWHATLTPFKGSNTLSPFIALQTRS